MLSLNANYLFGLTEKSNFIIVLYFSEKRYLQGLLLSAVSAVYVLDRIAKLAYSDISLKIT